MSLKDKVAGTLVVAGLITGATWYFQPHTPAEVEQQRRDQQSSDLTDSQDNTEQQRRQEGMEDGEHRRGEQLEPSERRPGHAPVDLPHIRWR